MRISDWSSDVYSSDLVTAAAVCPRAHRHPSLPPARERRTGAHLHRRCIAHRRVRTDGFPEWERRSSLPVDPREDLSVARGHARLPSRSEEHTSELQSLMRISYAVFCLKKKTQTITNNHIKNTI